MHDPVVISVVGAALVVILFTLVSRWWSRRRELAYLRRRSREARRRQALVEQERVAAGKLAGSILATSSTQTIAGYEVIRQIEAVFTDGHASPSEAVQALKALAAVQGANAIVNLHTDRPSSGKCIARGDAVIVKSTESPDTPGDALNPPPSQGGEGGGSSSRA